MARKSPKKHSQARSLEASRRKRARATAQPDPASTRSAIMSPDRALHGLQAAIRFWVLSEWERAAVAFQEVLELDPADPYSARYWLASSYFQAESWALLDELLERPDDDSGIWRFAQALRTFQRDGDTDNAQQLLVEADRREPGFRRYLLQDEVLDARRGVRFDGGPAERAFACARLFLPAWRAVPGAAVWARRTLKVPLGDSDREEVRRFPRADLRALPLRRETWQVGLRVDDKARRGDEPPLWLLGAASEARQEMRLVTVIDRPLTEIVAWNALLPALLNPLDGKPARPSTLVVGRREFVEAWSPLLAELGVRCRYEKDPQPIGQLLDAMHDVVGKFELPPTEGVDIREFPQSAAVWQADFFRSPAWIGNEREGFYRPWSVLVLEKSRSNALTVSHTQGDPTPQMLLEFLVRTMAQPHRNGPQRPQMVEVGDSDCYDYVRPRLEAGGVACRLVDELSELNEFCLNLARGIDESEKCPLANGRGVTRAHMESYYEAAAYYFRQAPWRRVPGEVPIEIRSDALDPAPRFGIVLGRTGVQLGLCIYDDWEMVSSMLGGYATPGENRALAVCYDEPEIMAAIDLQLIERLGWPIATPEAWPAPMRLMARRMPRSVNAKEVVFLDACLRAIPDFLKVKARRQTVQVETGTQRVELHLKW